MEQAAEAEQNRLILLSLSPHLIGWTVIALLVSVLLHLYTTSSRVESSKIPWISDIEGNSSWLSLSFLPGVLQEKIYHLHAHFRDLTEGVDLAEAGYNRFSKFNAPYIAPSYMDWHEEVVLPTSQIRWLADQPEHVLSMKESLESATQFRYTSPGAYEFSKPFHVEAISKVRLETCVADIYEALSKTIDRDWGMDYENFSPHDVYKLNEVLVEANARMFYGLPLAHNKDFLKNAYSFIGGISESAIMIRLLLPDLLKPMLAPLFTRNLRKWKKNCLAHIEPLVKDAMAKELPAKPTLLEVLSKIADKSVDKADRDPYNIGTRLLTAHYVGVETSLHTLVGAFADMFAAPAETQAALIKEAESVNTSLTDGIWTKHALDQLVKIDSAIRESMRVRTFKAKSLSRIVSAPNGVTLPSGQHLPRGTKVGVATLAMHLDEDIYHNAATYDAFRFCRDRSGEAPDKVTRGNIVTGMVNTSETWLAFGLGRHACPGRHMAAAQLKLITAYVLLNYEVKPLEEAKKSYKFCDFNVAPDSELQIRRKRRK